MHSVHRNDFVSLFGLTDGLADGVGISANDGQILVACTREPEAIVSNRWLGRWASLVGNWPDPAMKPHEYGKFAFDFIDLLTGLMEHEGVFATYRKATASLGFDFALIAELASEADNTPFRFRLPHVPSEFLDLYWRKGFAEHDPVARRAMRDSMPFEWREANYDPVREPRAGDVMGLARDFGLNYGLVIPVHSFQRPSAAISISSREKPDLSVRSKWALHLISIYALARVQQLRPTRPQAILQVSDREREVLLWSALGMNADEIGNILGVTERTVNFHIGSAMRKLGASNKTHAVALALVRRFIEL